MKKIPLTQGQFALVDDEDYEWLSQYKWYAAWHYSTRSFYAVRSTSGTKGKKGAVLMHRAIMGEP